MPRLNDEDVYCINHKTKRMVQNEGFNALMRLERTSNGIAFDSASGVPVLVFSCPECGYIELYAARTTKDWDEASQALEGVQFDRYRRFEDEVLRALRSPNSPLAAHEIQTGAAIATKGRYHEADIIAKLDDKVYVIEIKNTGSKRSLDSAAAQVRNYVELYRNTFKGERVYPLIVTPASSTSQDSIFGVPILKLDERTGRFVNPEVVSQFGSEH